MDDGEVMFYTINPKPSRRCDGCGVLVGVDAPQYKSGILIREGAPVTGFFHNKECYDKAVESLKGE